MVRNLTVILPVCLLSCVAGGLLSWWLDDTHQTSRPIVCTPYPAGFANVTILGNTTHPGWERPLADSHTENLSFMQRPAGEGEECLIVVFGDQPEELSVYVLKDVEYRAPGVRGGSRHWFYKRVSHDDPNAISLRVDIFPAGIEQPLIEWHLRNVQPVSSPSPVKENRKQLGPEVIYLIEGPELVLGGSAVKTTETSGESADRRQSSDQSRP